MAQETFDYQSELEKLGWRAAEYLRSKGWRHTSSTPGSFWLWTRTIPAHAATKDVPAGTLVLADQNMALTMQSRIDAMEPCAECGGIYDHRDACSQSERDPRSDEDDDAPPVCGGCLAVGPEPHAADCPDERIRLDQDERRERGEGEDDDEDDDEDTAEYLARLEREGADFTPVPELLGAPR